MGGPARGPVQRGGAGFVVDHVDTPLYQRPGVVRRVLALAASGGIGVLVGVLTAIVASFSIALAVIWLSNLLGS